VPTSILIVEDEDDIAQLLAMNLEVEGYDCTIARRGDDALDVALATRPDLVVLDLMLPGLDGVEVCRQLRKDPRTATSGIIMLTARSLPRDRIAGLEAGADDYVDKPFDVEELLARVQSTLRRSRQLRATSPLTGLPGNFEIEARIAARIADDDEFALLHIDLDNFKAYNDHYGFLRGDQAIMATSQAILRATREVAGNGTFVGHVGGDDFIVVCEPEQAEPLAACIVDHVDRIVPELYDDAAATAGKIEVVDRVGNARYHPLLTVSIGAATTAVRRFESAIEAAAVAVEVKRAAKAAPGSVWRIDRRRA
jgi:diguanylate cyclase (GGDEF)-like protein